MQLLNNYHKITKTLSEEYMQEQVDLFLKSHRFTETNKRGWKVAVPTIILREFRVPEVHRISDHVILINNKRVVNVECKLSIPSDVIQQAKDHLRWCDYSVIVLPPDAAYVTNSHLLDIIKHGIGLYYWFEGIGVFEFILPKFNRDKNVRDREAIIKRIKENVNKGATKVSKSTY